MASRAVQPSAAASSGAGPDIADLQESGRDGGGASAVGRDRPYAFTNGRLEVGWPVRAKRALATAGAMTQVPGSPTPEGGALDGTT